MLIICAAKMTLSLFDRVENAAGKGENVGYQHFLPFPPCFLKPLLRVVKRQDFVVKSCLCTTQSELLTTLIKEPFKNIVVK